MNTNRRKFLTSTTALTASAARGQPWHLGRRERRSAGGQRVQGHRLRVPVRRQRLEQHDRPVHGLRRSTRRCARRRRTWRSRRRSCSSSTRRARARRTASIRACAPLAPTLRRRQARGDRQRGHAGHADDQAQYNSRRASRPPNLFSHSDQQNAWMGLLPGAAGAHRLGRRAWRTRLRRAPTRAR